MGSMALIRQFFYDLDWYSQGVAKNKDYAIEADVENALLPKIWNSGSYLNFYMIFKIRNSAIKFICFTPLINSQIQ